MTQYISISQLKGGAGKTTTAITLCGYLLTQGKSVLAIDSDLPQGTFSAWASMLDEPNFKFTTCHNAEQLVEILKQADGDFDYVLIDTPPRIAEIMKVVLYVSDLVLIPMAATAPDIWAFGDMVETINETLEAKDSSVNIRLVWNQFKPTKKSLEIRKDAVESYGFKEIPQHISNYIAYSEVVGIGKHSLNYNHAKAKIQTIAFGEAVIKALNQKD